MINRLLSHFQSIFSRTAVRRRQEITRVVFRRFRKRDGGDVIALFPDDREGRGLISSYQHVGQHGAASTNIVRRTTLANPLDQDVQDLIEELTSRGYRLAIASRVHHR